MARKNSQNRNQQKSTREEKAELITWFLLVMVFGILYMLPEDTNVPNWVVPTAGAIILIGSGLYQMARHWRVSPITWFAGFLMLMFSIYGLYWDPNRDFLGASLVTFALVIGFGVITGET